MLAMMDKVPALAIDDLFNVLAMNNPARALFPDVAALPDDRRNLARFLFQTPAARDFYVEWNAVAAATVAQLRWTAGRFPHDTHVEAFITELSDAAEFHHLWQSGDVEVRSHGAKTIRHPTLGVLHLDYENFDIPGGQRQRIVAFSAGPNSPL